MQGVAYLFNMQYDYCMQKELQEISNTVLGYTFRGAITNDPIGDIFVVQAKNIAINEDITGTSSLVRVSSQPIRNPYFLEVNDILIVSRGSGHGSFRSSVFISNNKNVIASSSIHIIRITDVTVLPKYVSLYLNSDEGQKALMQVITGGSYIQSILVKNLADFKIPIPPIHIQKSIIALHENINQQQKILERKKELKQNIINASFTNLITK